MNSIEKEQFNKLMSYQLSILELLKMSFSEEQLLEIVTRHRAMWRKAFEMNVSPYIVANEVRDYEDNLVYA